MRRARDVMTAAVITCAPDSSVADVAKLMRDRNLGDVLITDDGKLVGIVTDRDIAVRVAAAEQDPRLVPIKSYMSKHLVTGQPDWDVNKLAKTMAHHQIRRLPIIENGMLVGIVSLGDLALKDTKRPMVSWSLKEISEPRAIHRMHTRGRLRGLVRLGLGLAALTGVALVLSSKAGTSLMHQLEDSKAADVLMSAVKQGRERISDMMS